MTVGVAPPKLEPYELIKCTRSDCENDLHCFLQKIQKPRPVGGPCRTCGKELVDFPRVQARDLGDIENTFNALSKEWIRHHFWERPFDQYALNHARRKGRRAFHQVEAVKRISQSLGKAQNFREGQQTPLHGNVLFYAQHALAACCRRCLEYWHGIEMGRELTTPEVDYLATLLLLYLDARLSDLDEEPVKVPTIKKARAIAHETIEPRKAANG